MRNSLLFLCILIGLNLNGQSLSLQEAINNYDYNNALLLIEQENSSSENRSLKIQAFKGLGKYEEAITELKEQLLQEPKNIRTRIELAECHRAIGKYKEALSYYHSAEELSPHNSFVKNQIGSLLCNTEQFAEAKEVYNSLLNNDTTALSLRMLGICYEGLEIPDSAIFYYEKTIEKHPYDVSATSRLISIYIDNKQYDNAIYYSENYRKTDTTNLNINRQNALAYCLSEQYEEAVKRYNSLVEQGDNSYLTNYYCGVSYFGKQHFYEAYDFLKKALPKNPNNTNLLYYLGRAALKTSWKQEGIDYMNQILEIIIPTDSTIARYHKIIAEGYGQINQPYKQIEELKLAYKYDPSYNYALYTIGLIYDFNFNDSKTAIRYLENFLKTKPDFLNQPEHEEDQSEGIAMGPLAYYKAAEKRIKELKEELFFKEGIKE